MEKQSQVFMAVDETGTEHRLLVHRQYVSSIATRGNPSAVAPGGGRIVTEKGRPVTRLKKGEYQIDATGPILRSSDPDAP